MGKLTFILGGARGGKSTFAQNLAEKKGGRVVFIATAEAHDEEMVTRIAAHQEDRPPDWPTLELPHDVSAGLKAHAIHADVFFLDCLTMLVSNLLLQDGEEEPDEGKASHRVTAEIDSLLAAIREGDADWIVVSNEVGMGLVPPYPLGRIYRDLLGRANQQFAAQADEVYWLVAGIPVPIHPFRE